MKRKRKRPPPPVQLVNQLRIHRTDEDTSWSVRMLSDAYDGLFTHWLRGRSEYCDPDGCQHCGRRLKRTWRGYCAAEVYLQGLNKWLPTVLELTEALEVEFRGVYQRGQVWRVWRNKETTDDREAVRGELVEYVDPDQLPPAFDYRPPLLKVYAVERIQLGIANPRPGKILMPLSDGPAPRLLIPGPEPKTAAPARPTDAQRARLAELLARRGMNVEVNGNGKG